MADSKKRWIVTYTKHVKQKRKVYQDGLLQLNSSTNKLMLFDECEKLLECRILKDEEVVCPGETLLFHSYLVDVGDPEGGDHTPVVDLKSQRRKMKIPETPSLIHRRKFTTPTISSGGRKDGSEKSLSPSQKVIRDFKKSEMQRYRERQSSPGMLKSRVAEWQVLYTTQVTQKAKKYHDGCLKLEACGSFGRQVILYDASREVLTSRFLKTDEIIRSGESMSFDGYLVEIGQPARDGTPFMDLDFQRNDENIVGETKTRHEPQNFYQGNTLDEKEWQVTYTSQITQKAKKYHDGLLRLKSSGSLRRQIMLYDSSRNLLDSRYLKKDDTIRCGESIAFDAHLVDIGEPVEENQIRVNFNVQGNDFNVAEKARIRHGHENHLEEWHALYTNQITQKAKKFHSGVLRLVPSGSYRMQVTLLNDDKTILSSKFLSSSEEVSKGCMITLPKYLVEVGDPCTVLQGKPKNSACPRNNENLDPTCLGKSEENACLRENADPSTSSLDRILLSKFDLTKKNLRDANQILSILQKPTAQESVAMQHGVKIMMVSSAIGLQDLDADDYQLSRGSSTNHGLNENMDIGGSSITVETVKFCGSNSSKETSILSGRQFSCDIETGSDKVQTMSHVDNEDVQTDRSDEAFTSSKKSKSSCNPHGPDDKVKSPAAQECKEMNEWPTFDLGF